MRKKQAGGEADGLAAEGETASPAVPAVRKKTAGTKRASVFGSLFGSRAKSEDKDGAANGQDDFLQDRNPSPTHAVRDPSDMESVSGPPSPKRDQSKDSPILLGQRAAGSKDIETSNLDDSPQKEQHSPSIFDISDRKEPSRSGKPPARAQGSRKEMFGARKEGSRVGDLPKLSTLSSSNKGEEGGIKQKYSSPVIGGPRFISARLPAMTVVDTSDNQSVNSFLSAHQLLEARQRAESDPCPLYGSTLQDDFGFPEEEMEGQNGQGNPDDDDVILSRKSSFQKPRAPSFNTETRTWEGRRSLQLSINQKGGEVAGTIHVSAATLDRLVEYVVSSNEFMEASQVSGFLLTYHSYVDAQGLLSALAYRYDISTQNNDQVARIRTLYVLQRWIEEHWYDFESDDILLMGVVKFALTRLGQFPEDAEETNKHDPCYSLLKKLASVQQLTQSKVEKRALEEQMTFDTIAHEDEDEIRAKQQVSNGEDGEEVVKEHSSIAPRLLKHKSRLLIKLEKAPPLDVSKDFPAVWHSKLEGKPMHIILANSLVSKLETARQITLIEHNLYKRIPPTELIAQATKQMAKPPEHVRAMIGHFNDVSKFVALSICSFTELTPRVYMLRKWIKIGRECLRLNNYNAVFEIMAGIHSVAVHRLHKTRGSLNVKTRQILEKLEEVTSRKNNYATYRNLLAQNTVPIQPAVPFIGATLTDLSFLDFGHRNVVENGEGDTLINFTKHRRVAQVIGTIKKFQDHPYLLDVSPELIKFFQTEFARAAELTDKEIYALSLICEPPAATAGSQAHVAFFDFHDSPDQHAREAGTSSNHGKLKKEDSKSGLFFSRQKKDEQ